MRSNILRLAAASAALAWTSCSFAAPPARPAPVGAPAHSIGGAATATPPSTLGAAPTVGIGGAPIINNPATNENGLTSTQSCTVGNGPVPKC